MTNVIGIVQDNCEDKYVNAMTANFGANKYSGLKTTGTIPLFVFGLYHWTHKRAYTVYIYKWYKLSINPNVFMSWFIWTM